VILGDRSPWESSTGSCPSSHRARPRSCQGFREKRCRDQGRGPGSNCHSRSAGVLVEIAPDRFAAGGIQCENAVFRAYDVHDTVSHQRRGLQSAVEFSKLEGPGRAKPVNIRGIDLVEWVVAPGSIGSTVSETVTGFLLGLIEALRSYFTEPDVECRRRTQPRRRDDAKEPQERRGTTVNHRTSPIRKPHCCAFHRAAGKPSSSASSRPPEALCAGPSRRCRRAWPRSGRRSWLCLPC